jgi:hypothetical protein
MRPVLIVATALLAVPLAACSTGSSSTAAGSTSAPATTAASSASSPGPTDGDGPSPSAGDCAGLTKNDMAKYLVYTQIVAQVRDANSLEGIKAGTIADYSPEKLDAILAKMSFLTGDPASAVLFFQKADASIAALMSGTPTAADFQAYQTQIGGISGVIRQQLVLNQAIGTSCKNLG